MKYAPLTTVAISINMPCFGILLYRGMEVVRGGVW